jgi:2-phospho-L-lactate guanylyltransferase (CobY/MobA/RfbA family)
VDRVRLAEAMMGDVLGALGAVAGIADVVVVTAEPLAAGASGSSTLCAHGLRTAC